MNITMQYLSDLARIKYIYDEIINYVHVISLHSISIINSIIIHLENAIPERQ